MTINHINTSNRLYNVVRCGDHKRCVNTARTWIAYLRVMTFLSLFFMVSVSFSATFLCSHTVMALQDRSQDTSNTAPTKIKMSLSGKVDVYDAVDSIYYGYEIEPPGHMLGTVLHIGDINNDGINDIALVSQEDYSNYGYINDGRIFIYYGSEEGFLPETDLGSMEPDHVIIGVARWMDYDLVPVQGYQRLTGQLESGDYNNDGCTDLVVSIPGTMYHRISAILWGEQGGWPREIILDTNYKIESSVNFSLLHTSTGQNYIQEIIDFYRKWGDMGEVWGGFGMDSDITNDYMITADIDEDGFDDLISGGFVTNPFGSSAGRVPKSWLTAIYWGDTGNKTAFYHGQDYGHFGKTIAVGDIDGDGSLDLVIGAPFVTKEHFAVDNKGAIYTIFDLKRYKDVNYTENEFFLPINTTCDFTIWGSGVHDWFGNHIILRDVNGDGKDEIIAGAPYADGPADLNTNAGQIYTFMGKQMNGFLKEMDADNHADSIMFGDQGYEEGPPEVKADYLGNSFEIGDLNGDGVLEFISAFPQKDLQDKDGRPRTRTGMISVYELKEVIPDGGGMVRISNEKALFTVEGRDMEDNLGYQIDVVDIDSDGLDDIIFSSPMADGVDNLRPRSGEVYILEGKGLVIKDLGIEGSSHTDGDVFLGDGELSLRIPYMYSYGSELVTGGSITIDPDKMNLEITFDRDSISMNDEAGKALIEDTISIEWSDNERNGLINITFETGWDLSAGKPVDVEVELGDGTGEGITRVFEDLLRFRKDVMIVDDWSLFAQGEIVDMPGRWFLPGEKIGAGDIHVVYTADRTRDVTDGPFVISLTDGEGEIYDTAAFDHDGILERDVPVRDGIDLNLELGVLPEFADNAVFGIPCTGEELKRRINIDLEAPVTPDGCDLSSDSGVEGFSIDGSFRFTWSNAIGTEGDPSGSGVREYLVNMNDEWIDAMEPGGLQATYYTDSGLVSTGLERTDPEINFSKWGPWGPEPGLIPPGDFSARWHGWISALEEREHYFRIHGVGYAKMFLDGEVVMEWTDISSTKPAGPFRMEVGEAHAIEVYYRHTGVYSGIVLLYQDDRGVFSPVHGEMLLHPTDHMEIHTTDNTAKVKVRAVDWSGRYSDSSGDEGSIDGDGPVFDTSNIRDWYGSEEVPVEVGIIDRPTGTGSGINIDTIEYRLMEEGGDWSEPVRIEVKEATGQGPQLLDLEEVVRLRKDWKGYIRFSVMDLLGNPASSGAVSLGIDTRAPGIEVTGPAPGSDLTSGEFNISAIFKDIGGSGTDAGSIGYRYSGDGGQWSRWLEPMVMMEGGNHLVWIDDDLGTGPVRVQFRGSDMVGNLALSDELGYTIREPVINMPPIPVIRAPLNGTKVYFGDVLKLDAFGTTDDGLGEFPGVRFTWISDIDGYLGRGNSIEVKLGKGQHRIFLFADDGSPGHNVSTSVSVEVVSRSVLEEDPPMGNEGKDDSGIPWPGIILIVAVSLLASAIVLAVYHRKRNSN